MLNHSGKAKATWVISITLMVFSINQKPDQPSQASTCQENPSYKNGISHIGCTALSVCSYQNQFHTTLMKNHNRYTYQCKSYQSSHSFVYTLLIPSKHESRLNIYLLCDDVDCIYLFMHSKTLLLTTAHYENRLLF